MLFGNGDRRSRPYFLPQMAAHHGHYSQRVNHARVHRPSQENRFEAPRVRVRLASAKTQYVLFRDTSIEWQAQIADFVSLFIAAAMSITVLRSPLHVSWVLQIFSLWQSSPYS